MFNAYKYQSKFQYWLGKMHTANIIKNSLRNSFVFKTIRQYYMYNFVHAGCND